MKTLELTISKGGANKIYNQYEKLNKFVVENFEALYSGAVKLQANIPGDYYAPERIQLGTVRLHKHKGIKYIGGFKYSNHPNSITENDVLDAFESIQKLIEAFEEDVDCSFTINIEKKQ